MKILKRLGYSILGLLVLANILLFVTGNTHLYLGLTDTYFKGQLKPSVDVPDFFPYRLLEKESTISYPISSKYNKQPFNSSTESAHKEFGTLAYLVIQNDSIITEKYFDNYDKNSLSNSFSMAKTILSIAVGIAVKEDKLSLEDPVIKYLPEFIQQKDSALKVKHLLTMTSGLNFRESYGNPFGFMAKAYYGKDLRALCKGYALELEPGTQHNYLGGNNLLLSFLLEKATGEKVGKYASSRLWKKLKPENEARWILDHENGDEKSFSGFYATARDYAKLGELFLKKGNMFGEQIVDSNYVEASIKPIMTLDTENRPTTYYGYAWWLTEFNNHKVFYMRGIQGQYVFCVPDKNLIIVRVGRLRSVVKSDGIVPDDVWVYLKEGFDQIQ